MAISVSKLNKMGPVYAYKSTLKSEFGLTDSLIRKLGPPDEVVPNPHYKSAPPSALYRRSRVEAFCLEHADAIKEVLAKRTGRSAAAKAAAKRREAELTEKAVAALKFITPLPDDFDELVRRAGRHLTHRGSERDLEDRDLTNTIRHEYMNYDAILDACSGQPGIGRDIYSPRSAISLALHDKAAEMIADAMLAKYGREGF